MKILIVILLFFICLTSVGQATIVVSPPKEVPAYVDLFPTGKRAPWGFRIYEEWEMQQIHHIDTFFVTKIFDTYYKGVFVYAGSASGLIFNNFLLIKGRDSDDSIIDMWFEEYLLLDTIYNAPTIEGFKKWEQNGRPRPIK